MPFNVQDFTATLNKSGVAHASHFEVQITGPVSTGTEQNMMLRCDTVDIPGRSIATTEYRIYGPLRKIPYGAIYTDVACQFLLSEDLQEKSYFEQWQDKIVNHGAFGSSRASHNIGYYNDYVGNVTIRQFSNGGDLMSVHTLQEAYPVNVSPVQMSWGSNEFAKLAVAFAYRDYKVVYENASQPGLGASFGFSFGANGFGLSGSLPGIGNISVGSTGLTGALQTPFGLIRKL